MILKCCISCEHHVLKIENGHKMSHCSKENLWCKYSKCVNLMALERFLDHEQIDGQQRRFSALSHAYGNEE